MTFHHDSPGGPLPPHMDRRELLAYTAAFGGALLATQGHASASAGQSQSQPQPVTKAPKRYDMKKSINLWAFPYPQQWSLLDCFRIAKDAGFDGVEVNFDLESDISPKASEADLRRIGDAARQIGIEISGVCSFLFWPYALTSNDAARRNRGLELAAQMIRAARLLGTENLLVVPGAVYIPWIKDEERDVITPVPNDVCWQRATEGVRRLLPEAEKHRVWLNMENIFANGFLFSPDEMNRFVDQFDSPWVQIHFDTGNIMQYQMPEHWIPQLGKRIKNVHLKEFSRKNAFDLNAFRPLLDGSTDWPAVIAAFDRVGYRGYLTFEYFFPWRHYPEALIYQTSDSLDRMLGRV
jgi:L-ribulose-5-phosphate 3-epimerase